MNKICTKCKIEKDINLFYNQKNGALGKTSRCKSCIDSANRQWDLDNKERNSKYKYDRRREIKKKLFEYKGGKCSICGLVDHESCYDFHHLDPKAKEFGIAYIAGFSFERAVKEVEKCILLCAHCHRKVHAGIIKLKE